MTLRDGDHDTAPNELVGRLHAGDALAFEQVFLTHANDIYRFCLRRAVDRDDAEDLVSVVFLEAWKNRERIVEVEQSILPWLYGVTTNVIHNLARSHRRHRAAIARFHAANPETITADHADDVARYLDAVRAFSGVVSALAKLPAKERDVADLCLLGGMTPRAAAVALGLPEGTIKSRLQRARRRLQRLLHSSELPAAATSSGHIPDNRPTGAAADDVQPMWSQA